MQCVEAETTYKSRSKVLQRFFLRSRNRWKAKCRRAKSELKLARNQIRAVEASRAAWKTQARDAKAQAKRMAAELQEARRQLEEVQSKNGRRRGK
jgi:chromosome segregation ATPase